MQVSAVLVLSALIIFPLSTLIFESVGRDELTLDYYLESISEPSFINAFYNTLLFATGTTLLATIIGVTSAWIVNKTAIPFRERFEYFFIAPFFISPFIGAMVWVYLIGPKGLISYFISQLFHLKTPIFNLYSIPGMIWVAGLYFSPYVFLFTSSALKSMNPALEEASTMSGVGTLRTVWHITLRIISPSILSSVLLTFVAASSMFSVPLILGRPYRIYLLTTAIYDLMQLRHPQYGLASALSILLLGLTAFGIYFYLRSLRGREFVTIGGRGFRAGGVINIGKWKYIAFALCLSYSVVTLILPFSAIVLASFMTYYAPTGAKFTLGNYDYVLHSYPLTIRSMQNSLFMATVGATLCTLLTFFTSYILVRTRVRGKSILEFISTIPVALPAVVLAVALLRSWVGTPIYGTLWLLIIAYITIYSPYGIRSLSSTLRQIDPELEESSAICGVSWQQTMARVIFPLLKPGLMATWIILFISFLREVSSSILLSTYGCEAMSVALYELWWEGSFCQAAAMATIQILIIFTILFIARKVAGADITKIA